MEVTVKMKQFGSWTKALGIACVLALSVGTLGACGSSSSSSKDDANGRVYYLNKKAEEQKSWVKLGQEFSKETGIPVQIQTGGQDYDSTLKSEMAKKQAPTMFQADGPSFMNGWADYAIDMSDSEVYKQLNDNTKNKALKNSQGKPIAIPYAVESYGIIYNKALLKKYFDAPWSTVKSIDNLNNFKALKTAADEIQAHKADLGVKGAFSSAGMDTSSAFRYDYHMATLPVFYEAEKENKDITKTPSSLKGTYVNDMKNIYDLYIKDATIAPSAISGKTMDDSSAEFATGQSVFYQNGVWSYTQIKGQSVQDADMGVLPIYMGIPGEEDHGLTQVISNYWCINSKVSKKDQEATQKFLKWLITSDKSRTTISKDMGLVTPFKTFEDAKYQTTNPLVLDNLAYQKAGKKDTVLVPDPSHQWEDDLKAALLNYAQGSGSWDAVQKVYTENWAKEYKLTYNN